MFIVIYLWNKNLNESIGADQIVMYVPPILDEENPKKNMKRSQRLDWAPVDVLKIRVGLCEDAKAYVLKENLGTLPLASSSLGKAVALIAQCGRCKDLCFDTYFNIWFIVIMFALIYRYVCVYVCVCVCMCVCACV